MYLIDMHCDTLGRLVTDKIGGTLLDSPRQVNMEGMQKADVLAQFFACFVDVRQFAGADQYTKAYEFVKTMLTRGKKDIERSGGRVKTAGHYGDIVRNKEEGIISALFTVEEGGIIEGRPERVESLYQEGIRLITLLWNAENCMGYPNNKDPQIMEKGLKPFGFEAIEQMNRLGMIVDVSHLSDGGFWDVAKHSKKPFVASHSNARKLMNHPRNLSDDMLKAIGNGGGTAGLNFYPAFVHPSLDAKAEYLGVQVRYMADKAGMDAVSIGTDFDGFTGDGQHIRSTAELPKLADVLAKEGFSQSEMEKIFYKNALRVIREVCG